MEVIEKPVPTEYARLNWLAKGGQIKVFFATHHASPDAPAAWGMTAWKDGFLSGNKVRLRKESGVIESGSVWDAAAAAVEGAAHLMAESLVDKRVANGSPWELCLVPSHEQSPSKQAFWPAWAEFMTARGLVLGISRQCLRQHCPSDAEMIEAGIEALRSAGRIIRVERDVDDPRHAEAKLLARAASFHYAVNQAVKV